MSAVRPRVLQVGKYYAPHRGGIESHLRELCAGVRGGVDLRIVVANHEWGRGSEEVVDGVEVRRQATWAWIRGAPVCPGLVRSIRESRADIVHLHLPNPGAVLAYLASGHKGRLVVTYHSDIVRQRVLGTIMRPIHQRLLAAADAILVASREYLRSSAALAPHRDRCVVIPYGISVDAFDEVDPDRVQDIRDAYGPRLVLSVGRLVHYKGFVHLIEAMRTVDAQLVIIGDGPLRSKLQARVSATGTGRRVTLLGHEDDVVPYFQAADVFALPSITRAEAFGIVQLEAMACRTPVVNTALESGVPFVSPDGVTGFTVPPANPHALANALRRLLEDPPLREAFGRAARERVELRFSAEEMVRRTLGIYREVIAGRVASDRDSHGRDDRPHLAGELSERADSRKFV